MARSITAIQNEIINELAVNGITVSASLTSRRRIWTWVVAFAILTLEKLFDFLRIEINEQIAAQKVATLPWYAEMMLQFQYGYTLVPFTDYYDNTGLTPLQIANSKVIKYAAATEQEFTNGRFGVRIKVAGENGAGERVKLSDAERDAAREYFKRIRFAGVYGEVTTDDADSLKLSLKVYYNPLVLNNTGARLDGTTATPLQDAIAEHLENLPFNGRFNLTELVDAMQAVDGVSDPRIISAQTAFALNPHTEVIDERIPDAGYLKIYNNTDLTIQWIPKSGV
jgi:hypothetical protein